MSKPVLKAAYRAPNHESFTASQELATSTPPTTTISTSDKTAFLAALRIAATGVQDEVNRELTARMVLDAQAGTQTASDAAAQKEEQNYGEEGMDADE
ncbi:hypothetical protein SCUCBS95973_007545 [Sporothrix curviconia]|uniref:EKC/KEOPS complex subunit GON7 n=1 Tax=Sporothrix curviconia TaxID=1260050 RepID=A0ABP0CFE0_9PEZI